MLLFEGGIAGTPTLGRVIGLVAAVAWLGSVVVKGTARRPHLFHMVVYLFALWNAASVFWSADVDRTVYRVVTYVQQAVLVFILWDLYTSLAALKVGLQAFVLGAYVSVGSTIINYLAGRHAYSSRYAATGWDPNNIGFILVLGIPVAWHQAISLDGERSTGLLKLANYAYIPAATLAVLLTASRGALVAALPAFLFVVGSLTRLKLLVRVVIMAALVVAILGLQTLVPRASLQRLATTSSSIAEGDIGGRLNIWREGLVVYVEHPVLGVGSGAFRSTVEAGHEAHNAFLSVLIDLGIIGFLLFAAALGIAGHQAIRQPKWESRFWLTVLLVWAVGASSLNWVHRKPTWLFLGLATVSGGLLDRHLEHRRRAG